MSIPFGSTEIPLDCTDPVQVLKKDWAFTESNVYDMVRRLLAKRRGRAAEGSRGAVSAFARA